MRSRDFYFLVYGPVNRPVDEPVLATESTDPCSPHHDKSELTDDTNFMPGDNQSDLAVIDIDLSPLNPHTCTCIYIFCKDFHGQAIFFNSVHILTNSNRKT